jgi:ABC-type Fe3+-hydroxamate transport system substrate-binding protein
MIQYRDQMNQTIRLSGTPRRIVSLVPSQTELLHALGVGEKVVGITKFCIHPHDWFRAKTRVGGTKNVSISKVQALQPDLILGNKEENEKENIEALGQIAPVWMSDIFNLEDALSMIYEVGRIVEKRQEADAMIQNIQDGFKKIKALHQPTFKKQTVLYLIWKNPYLAAGKDTFIDDMLSRCGFANFIAEDRYPTVTFTQEEGPDYVFLSSEPYPFKEIDLRELESVYAGAKVLLVDGEMFSWYGSRLVEAIPYFMTLIRQLNQ